MRFLADMGVSRTVVEWLRGEEHDAMHLRELGLQTLPDPGVLQKAIAEDRILLTFDLDFGEIIALSGGARARVIIFRLNVTTPAFVISRLQRVLKDASAALEEGAVVVVEDQRHRIRRLPIGS